MSGNVARPFRHRLRHVGVTLVAVVGLSPVVLVGAASAQTRPTSPMAAHAVSHTFEPPGAGAGARAAALLGAAGASGSRSLARSAAASSVARAGALAARPHSSSAQSTNLIAELDKVTSSTGVKLYLGVTATNIPSFPQIDDFNVSLENIAGTELHQWDFDGAALTTSGGGGTFKTGTKGGSYATASLALTPTGKTMHILACNAENYTLERFEKVTGTIKVNTRSTGSHAWGSVTASKFGFDIAVLDTQYAGKPTCSPTTTEDACQAFIGWNGGSNTVLLFGQTGPSTIEAFRSVALATPKNSSRIDFLTVKAPSPVLATSGTSASMKVTTSGGVATGSAKLVSTAKPTTSSEKCKGASGKETSKDWAAKFTADTLRFTAQIFGPISTTATTGAAIDSTKD